MLQPVALQRVVDRAAGLVLEDPLPGKLTGLDLLQDVAHLGPDPFVDDPVAPGQVAVLGRVADRIAHVRDAVLIDQVDNQLHLVQTLKVGDLRLVARFDQGLKAGLNEPGEPPAEDALLTKQIRLGLFGKCRFDDAGLRCADPPGIGQRRLLGLL